MLSRIRESASVFVNADNLSSETYPSRRMVYLYRTVNVKICRFWEVTCMN